MDPISVALTRLAPRAFAARGFSARNNWSIQFRRSVGVKFYAITSGECLLTIDALSDAIHLRAGDGVLLPAGRPFRFSSDAAMKPIDALPIVSAVPHGEFALLNGGGDFSLLGSCVTMTGQHARMLLDILPPVMRLESDTERAALRWSLEQMMYEMREPQPGGQIVSRHHAHLMLVQGLRSHLRRPDGGSCFFASGDVQVGAAIKAMHEDPARRWTLRELAGTAAMSRSAFALKFKQMVGAPPLEYLTRWRMLLAADKMATSDESVSVIAATLGYNSESAFSSAFKHLMGSSPRAYTRAESGSVENQPRSARPQRPHTGSPRFISE